MDKVLAALEPVKRAFDEDLSWADLIVMAGTMQLEEVRFSVCTLLGITLITILSKATGIKFPFCGGRTDARDGEASTILQPLLTYGGILYLLRNN